MDERPTPADTDVPGGFPVTPSIADEDRPMPFAPFDITPTVGNRSDQDSQTPTQLRSNDHSYFNPVVTNPPGQHKPPASDVTLVSGRSSNAGPQTDSIETPTERRQQKTHSSNSSQSDASNKDPMNRTESRYMPLKAAPTAEDKRPSLQQRKSIRSENDLFKVLSQRRQSASGKSEAELEEEHQEIEKLMSRMFGKARQQHSEEEKTRHSGVVFRNLTVKGAGLGASLQPTVGDIFLGLPRIIKTFFTRGAKAASGKPPVRELLSNFEGCVRPGEMLLVLGRPGSGCSTFLKAFCNQRDGYEAVEGDVTYGGTDASRMKKDFRGEVIYNPEDDLHYATLTVQRTLRFALQTRTPGKESRLEGESREDYMTEFMRVVTKLFWIEHTLGTKVGNEFVRGVSGGEKKRVSIAEGNQSCRTLNIRS